MQAKVRESNRVPGKRVANETGPVRTGLRELKKARTREAIQRHALRLFDAQGYEATTIDQIVEAAEVSQSTFFRYFPTKEDVVLYDTFDPVLIDALRRQPPELDIVSAVRAAFRELPADGMGPQWERQRLILATPELRARMLEEFARTLDTFAAMIAQRTGRDPADFAVRAVAGAVIGVGIAALFSVKDNPAEFLSLFDAGLAQLQGGLAL